MSVLNFNKTLIFIHRSILHLNPIGVARHRPLHILIVTPQ